MSDWVATALRAMTLEEKIAMLAGHDLWETVPIERVGVPALKMVDGPNGARGGERNHGPTSMSFPVGAAMGATFDPELIESLGRALAEETRSKGADVLLGPTVNIPRVPVAGRNFECFSEDPVLSGTLAAAYITGVQDEGVGACIKHFVCNDQEHERRSINAEVDERALREIYLEPFRIAIERSKPWAVMSAYNTVNGVTASENPLLEDVLRGEFRFEGAVISDWRGTYSPGVVSSGLDLEMPGPARWMTHAHVRQALEAGTIDETLIDTKVRRLLTLLARTGARHRHAPPPERATELAAHRELARRISHESIVLLENNSLLPIADRGRIAVIGELAAATPVQGGGSSGVNPHRRVSILAGLQATAPADTEIVWATGPSAHRWPPLLDVAQTSHGDGTPGLLAEYFATPDLDGDPVRALPAERLLIFQGAGDAWVDHEAFSLRLTGRMHATENGRHQFSVSAGGRVRVMADGDVVGDAWQSDASEPIYWELDLTEGQEVELVVEYGSRPGELRRWLSVGCAPPLVAEPIADACELAAGSDMAIVVVGLTAEWESEGFDRADLALPGDQARLVAAVAAAQPNTAVVVVAGSAVEMPWRHDVGAVLQVWYGGQEVGHAVADVLFGRQDPGGRLPVTFPYDADQHPGMLNYPGEAGTVRYGEGVYVGYRAFDKLGLEPMYPFGYGLSYTDFAVADVVVEQRDGDPAVTATLQNVGSRKGVETIQVFARDIGGVRRRLVGFAKCRLAAGASQVVEIPLPLEHLRWWDPGIGDWRPAAGTVDLDICGTFGRSAATLHLN